MLSRAKPVAVAWRFILARIGLVTMKTNESGFVENASLEATIIAAKEIVSHTCVELTFATLGIVRIEGSSPDGHLHEDVRCIEVPLVRSNLGREGGEKGR